MELIKVRVSDNIIIEVNKNTLNKIPYFKSAFNKYFVQPDVFNLNLPGVINLEAFEYIINNIDNKIINPKKKYKSSLDFLGISYYNSNDEDSESDYEDSNSNNEDSESDYEESNSNDEKLNSDDNNDEKNSIECKICFIEHSNLVTSNCGHIICNDLSH